MSLLGVDATIGDQTEEMQRAILLRSKCNRLNERGIGKEAAVSDGAVDAHDIHADDASGAQVQMSNLGIPHLAVGQANKVIARVDQSAWKFFDKMIVRWLASQRDGVAVRIRAIAPSVENGENNRFFSSHC